MLQYLSIYNFQYTNQTKEMWEQDELQTIKLEQKGMKRKLKR